jgi:sterile alpha motif and leucine zipper containing kinase AZK
MVALVSDFGTSKADDGTHMTATRAAIGTPICKPPEVINSAKSWSKAGDVYGIAIILFMLFVRKQVFDASYGAGYIEEIVRTGYRPDFTPTDTGLPVNAQMQSLITRCWDQDPTRRPELSEVRDALMAMQQQLP